VTISTSPLLVDGLEAEREQGITIDVAYRFFTTSRRSFIVTDTPGHEQYTRNMATGASKADLAVLLVDARKGVLVQTRRHSLICSLLGLRHVVLAVNKIDLVSCQSDIFDGITAEYSAFASQLSFSSIVSIPVSARYGDNVTRRSDNTPWYHGPTLLDYLETIDVDSDATQKPFRFPVQWVNRPNLDFRCYAGTIASGTINDGDPVVVAGSGQVSRVKQLLTYDGPQASAEAGDAITITLADEVDIARGDLLVCPASRPEVSDQFSAHLIWMSDQALMPGRPYFARIGTKTTPITVTEIKYKIDVNTREHLATHTLDSTTLPSATWQRHTLGAGMIAFGLRRGTNVHWQPTLVGKSERAAQSTKDRQSSGSPACPGRASRPSPISSNGSFTPAAITQCCWMATICATASIATWASPKRTGSRTFVAPERSPNCWWTQA
jgi:bifunctional enzyme CysN/CysC